MFAISLLRYLGDTWQMDSYREKLLRRTVDDLMRLHHFPSLGQQAPSFVTARVHAIESDDAHWVDLTRIRGDLARLRPHHYVLFDIRLVTVASDGSRATVYIFPWAELELAGARLVRDVSQLASYTAEVPSDVDPMAVARALQDGDQHAVAG